MLKHLICWVSDGYLTCSTTLTLSSYDDDVAANAAATAAAGDAATDAGDDAVDNDGVVSCHIMCSTMKSSHRVNTEYYSV